jgi:hypothetical protein
MAETNSRRASSKARNRRTNGNPGELLIFGNPRKKKRHVPNAGHKKDCPCFACKHQRAVKKTVSKMPKAVRAVFDRNSSKAKRAARDRAAQIRGARLNGWQGAGNFTDKEAALKLAGQLRAAGKRVQVVVSAKGTKSENYGVLTFERNPDATKQAVKLYKSFHGKDPKEITEKHISAAHRQDYAALGALEYLQVLTPVGQTAKFNFEGDGVTLASSPDGKQLYCIGGNQDLSRCIEAGSLEKDFVDLGEATEVQYLARKVHGKFQPVSYYHKFGEVNGARPQLMFDKLKKQIFFIGGDYWIDAKQGVSPGIEN